MADTGYVLAIDQGTTGTTGVLIDRELQPRGRGYREFPQIYPQPGWVEHDAEEIWGSTLAVIEATLADAGVSGEQIAAIGITNQRETTVLWDRKTGAPVHNAIVWQCRRTAPLCEELREAGHETMFRRRTGLVLDAYFSGTKLRWLLDNVAGARTRAEKGELAFGTIDTFLLSRLTAGAVHATDVSNASRTLMMDLETLDWAPELLDALAVPASVLPKICGSSEVYGTTRGVKGLPDGIPVAGIAGDQQAALFGQACFARGDAKCTFGTGAFLLVNTGDAIVHSKSGLLTSVGWRLGDQTTYVLEGSVFIAGAAVQWLRDGLGLLHNAADIEALAASVPDTGGVVFVPALTGLGAPHWNMQARGLVCGIDRGTTAAHLARATLEGIAFQVHDVFRAMAADLGSSLQGVRVDGGACQNGLLMQLQADLLDETVIRPKMIETTALGAALLAGLAVGLWNDLDAIRSVWKEDRRFSPSMDREEAAGHLARWNRAIARVG